MNDDSKYDVISYLLEEGFSVVEIPSTNEYWMCEKFSPFDPSSHIYQNSMVGINITKWVSNLGVDLINSKSLLNIIYKSHVFTMHFSENINFLWYQNEKSKV